MLKCEKSAKKFRKVVMILIAVIMILGIYIKEINTQKIEIKTIGVDEIQHMDATISAGNGTVNPIYRPKWTKVSSTLNVDAQTLSVVVKGNASESQTVNGVNIKYNSNVTSTLSPEDIMVYIDGELDGDVNKNGVIDEDETTTITKNVSSPIYADNEVTQTISLSNFGEAVRQEGKEFTEWSGNVAIKIGGRGQDESTYNANVLTDKYGNESMMETDMDGTNDDGSWINVIFKDGSIDHNSNGTMFTDFVKPEFTYEYANTVIDHDTKTVTVVFDVTDKYFDSTVLSTDSQAENITVKLGGKEATNATKKLTKLSDITATVNGNTSTKIGEKYQLVVSNLDQGDGGDYSGIMTLAFPADIVTDKSANTNIPKSITIGTDDPTTDDGHDNEVIVDVVDPVWKTENISIDGTTKTVKVDLIATDKYLTGVDNCTLTTDDITLTVDGDENANTAITKTLSTPTFSENVTTGLKEIKYTLTLEDWEEASLQAGKSFLEYSGTAKIKIKEGTITDDASGAAGSTSGSNVETDGKHNTSKEYNATLGHVDFIKPRIEKVSTERDVENKTETIIFNVVDKYLYTTDEITADDITVYIDKEVATGITKTLTRETANDVTATINDNEQVVSQQYKLVLSDFEQSGAAVDSTRNYKDWSGTVSIDIAENVVKDKGSTAEGSTADSSASANKNEKTTIEGDFVDYIQPKVTYQYVTGDINYNEKTFTMKFNITDKYFTNSTLATEYANATTDEEKLEVLKKYLTIKVDGEDVTTDNNVSKKLIAIEDVRSTKTINKTVDGTVQTGLENQLIGKSFTLEISQLQQNIVDIGDEYLDYSGVVTVAIKENSVTDNGYAGNGTNVNGNIVTTITSGVDIPGETGDGTIVDVVDPIWEIAGTATAKPSSQTASISVKGTDKYLKTIGLTANDITVEVDGVLKTQADGVTVTVTEDTSAELAYGKQYKIKIDGYSSEAYQVKITLKEGLIVDDSGNTSKETSFILFSSLKETSTENDYFDGFLGNTDIRRGNIEKIIFQDNLDGINDTRWDVTQMQDETIWGWYTTDATTGNYTVYIGSYIIINANVNSSYLFSYIGYDPACKTTGDSDATDGTQKFLIENLDLLHVDGVTNMSYMFQGFGYSTMKSFTLGSGFDTNNVTNMQNMFKETGYTAMTSLDLGDKFDTSNVTDMTGMFTYTGYIAMISLNLENKFNTINVTNMQDMFRDTGYTAMTSLNLGNKFNTNSVTNMMAMFWETGYTAMTSLELGNEFNTKNVTNMEAMFYKTGYTVMTSLDLGDKFDTSNVNDMIGMFNNTGSTAMTSLDLGPAFTQIAKSKSIMFENTGKNGEITIYTSEQIYLDKNNFKTDTDATESLINFTRGTINPKYRTEWVKEESTISKANKDIAITLRGRTNAEAGTDFTSDVTSTLTVDNIHVLFDGEEATTVTKSLATPTTATNAITGANDVLQVLTLSNLEEALRQQGKDYKEWSGNISLKIDKKTLTDDTYQNQNLQAIDTTGEMIDIELKDTAVDKNTDGTMFTDYIEPEYTYEYANTTIDHDKKTVTVVFDVTDKYFKETALLTDEMAENIAVKFGGVTSTKATKTLTKVSDLTATINGKEGTKIGERYQLVITNIDQGEGGDYSGVMTMSFPAGELNQDGTIKTGIIDKSGNLSLAKTITIGIDDPSTDDGHDTGVIVDVVDPIWKVENINIDNTSKKVTADVVATDKYLTGVVNSTLTTDDITLTVDGDENANTAITKTLSTPTFAENTTTGLKEIRYTLTLDNWEEATKQSGKSFLEYSGTTKITIAEGTVRDDAEGAASLGEVSDGKYNTNKEQSFTLGHVDFIKPRVEKVSSVRDTTAKTETVTFNVIDKYLDTTKLLTADDIKVYVDGEEATTLTKELTRVTANDVSATINGNAQTVLQQYQLVISDFEKARNDKNYKDWSGTVTIEVAENVVKDKEITSDTNTSGGNTSDLTILKGDFVDFINPDLKYVHQDVDIDKTGKTYTMTFTVTDKYYRTGKLTLDDLTIKMQNGQKDAQGNEIIYNLKDEPVTISLQDAELKAQNVPITNTTGDIETVSDLLIGHTYTLTISNLEQLEIKAGLTTADYSGIITVAVEGDKISDRGPAGDNIDSNGNIATTITSGVNIPGGTTPDDAKAVDVVDPIWEKVSSSANAIDPANKTSSTATITFRGTDTYFANSTLTSDKIKVLVNGTEATGVSKTLSAATALTEERKEFGKTTTATKQYGVEYTLTITGFAQDANQVKIQLPAGTITDESGNGNKVTEMLLYNTLISTATEGDNYSSGFLGSRDSTNENVKSIRRDYIENVTFETSIPDTIYNVTTGEYIDANAWDVSAVQDKSIIAWYEVSNEKGALTVHIGSNDEIFANQDSSYLFQCIGYYFINKSTAAETITNIDLLNVSSVTNMSNMFWATGSNAMTSLNLGDNFDTSNVTNMDGMFNQTGFNAMTSLDLGDKFDTSNVTDMSAMFFETGYTAMTSLDLGDKFDTRNVTDMSYMFNQTGYTAMTSLDLRDKFDTRNVTNMSNMFNQTGYSAMTSLNLGDKFDTSNVTNMQDMFNQTGYTAMTSLDLGDNFDTSNVTNMIGMFSGTGYTAMTSLDLRDKFDTRNVTDMSNMFNQTGYTAMTSLDLRDKFDTRNVTNMSNMFNQTGYSAMTSLDLRDKFDTRNVINMYGMFSGTGYTAMTSLDLGPAFAKISDKEGVQQTGRYEFSAAYVEMFTNTGKENEITIYASEQIYLDRNNFKFDTDRTDSAIEFTRGTINPKYRTEWVKEESTINTANKDIAITLRGRTNAEAGADFTSDVTSTLTADNIHVYFNGEEATTITKSLAEAATATNTVTGANDVLQVLTLSNLEEALRQQGKDFKEWSGNISLKIDKKTLTDDTYQNQNLQAIDTTGEMIDIELKDTAVDKNTDGTMFTDYINPEFTYIYSDGNINYTDKTLTLEFSITDKYFDSSTLLDNIDNIAIKLIDTDPNVTIPNEKITKELIKTEDISKDIDGDGNEEKIGEKYKLVIKGLEQQTADGKYKDYSGPMSVSIPAGVAKDKSENENIATTITIGVNEPGGNTGDQEIVDVVDPLWKTDNINIDHENKKVTVDLIGTDKYYASNSLTTDSIKVSIDGEDVTTENVQKSLSDAELLTETRNGQTVTYGVKYTLTLSNWEETEKQTNKQFFEWSGTTNIEIAEDTIKDESNNTSNTQKFELGHVDFIQPKIEKVSSSKDSETKTETFVFNVIDKYLDTEDLVTTDEISVYVDNELVPDGQITRTLTKESDLTAMVNGTSKVVGHQYKLILSDFEQTRTAINYNREYSDWSGTVSIKVAEGAVKDTNTPTPNTNTETTIEGDFVDFIKPNATYQYTASDIDYDGKTFTMVFDVTDKYYTSGTLSIEDLDIKIDGEEPNWDNTGVHGVIKELTVEDRTNTVNGETKVIGKRYTLKLSHLEQLEKLVGKETMDYSGVITVAVPADKLADTSNNKNNAITITSGIEVKGEPVTGDGTIVDVVDPIWEKIKSSVNVNAKTASITVNGTDKYFASSDLTADKIKVFAGDTEISGVNIEISEATPVNSADGITQIGVQHVINLSGSALDFTKGRIKIQIQPGAITDNSGNTNKATDLILFTSLKSANVDSDRDASLQAPKAFLGNEDVQRTNVDNITFVDNIPASVYDKSAQVYVDDTAWDVSEMQDKSIIAWYETNANGTVKVYIGSDDAIFGNVDSSYLFAGVGVADSCTATETITNIDLLNVSSVTNMSYMFYRTGNKAMTSLELGNNFDTSNVTDMKSMFKETGYTAMTSLDLGDNFDTSNVTDMSYMFSFTGRTAITSLDLGNKFDTSNVTNMSNMFGSCGQMSTITSLDLGDKFNTSNVTNMNSMFQNTGITSVNLGDKFDTSSVTNMGHMFESIKFTSLDLRDKFDTSSVTNMSHMFGSNLSITSLDLGDKFDTSSVTDMTLMFTNCISMTSLDLGPAFIKIAETHTSMFLGTGKENEITIYAPEQIYLDKNNFKTDANATTSAIEFTRGTINPKYRTEWVKEESTINTANKDIAITLRGRTNAEAGVDFTSDVTSSLTADNIHVLFDGEEATTITKSLAEAATATNTVTGANDVLQVLTLSNLEEALRQQGKNFKEWSGNISLKIDKKTLTDTTYSNQNLQAIDTTGEMIDIEFKDEATDKNTDGVMFTDYIKPEFTYEYFNAENDTDANTVIDYEKKTITVVFDVTDKYFKESNITADNMTIKVGGEEPDWTKSTKTLTKKTLDEDKVVGNITYKANGDIYYTVNGIPTKIGERYELVVSHLEVQNGVGYSGAMTLSFPAGELNSDGTLQNGIVDKSGNLSLAKTITIGIDDPENPEHPDHTEEKILDLVNPLWTGPHNVNTVDRTNSTVDIKILGSDKYYETDVFAEALANGTINTALSKIKVYVDGVEQTSITKTITKITSDTELQELIAKSDLQSANAEDVKVGYTLTLGNFEEVSGETKIVIEAGTITDQSGNTNTETTIPVGNIKWVEANEPLNESDTGYPRYHAFRDDIVDFIKPVIKYQYSAVEDDTTKANPEIDYEAKTLTVKFTVTDKYLIESSIMNADGTLNTNNVRIRISTLNDSGVEEFKDITEEGISTTITSTEIIDGYEYTLVVKDFEQVYNNKGKYMDYSGIVQLAFAEGQIDDTSGNKNVATTITLDTGTGDNPNSGIVVDVIDPIIEKTAENLSIVNTSNGINRDKENETGTVTLMIKATDKYLSTGTLQNTENVEKIKVKVVKPDGTEVIPDTITKSVTQVSKQATSITYRITLGNFETNEGVTSVIIPEGVIKDTSGNGNKETEILVGNSTWTETGDSKGEYTAFRDSIVDFTMPVWRYATSSITRNRDEETGTVKVKILGSDIYYLKDTLTTDNIFVYVANSETPDAPVTTITKSLEKITDTAELEGADTGYYLTLGNFGTHDGQVKIAIADNTIKDTSGNGNKITEMLVGNPNWVETDVGDSEESPKYTAFRDSIVDFIKPTIKYQYTADTNPIVDQENKTFTMTFDATDTNFLESEITLDDIQILVDDADVTDTLTKNLTSEDITDGSGNGLRYTLTLSNFELQEILDGDSFMRHSGKIELVIASGKVKDTSGNTNIETKIIVDNDDGDDAENYVRVDFIKPKLYFVEKHISWDNRYATVTIAGTDRFYDFNTVLNPDDITLYQENSNGDYVQVTDLPISIKSVKTEYGYNFVIRLDDFEEEYKMKINIPAGKIADLDGHYNDETDIIIGLDNKKPVWRYVSTDTSQFESDGKISFNVKGQDKFLNLTKSSLEDGDVQVYKDGVDISSSVGITINYQGQDETEKSKSYKIDVTDLTEAGTYSLVFKAKTLIDEFNNESATTTISFSKSIISSNTDNYQKVTYHASPDFEQTHEAYVHELMSVNTTGTNAETTTFRPSTIGEIYDNGKNTLFAEPFTYENGTQSAYSFRGWALANEDGFIIDKDGNKLATSEGSTFDETKATIYGLYDEIPDSAKSADDMVHLKAVWQKARVIFVSNGSGDNSADGLSPTTPVKDLQTAYSKLNTNGTTSINIIVIMDKVEWNSSTKLTGNATITNLYAGVDYKAEGAELKISSNLEVDGDIRFDNIKLYSNSTSVSDGSDYLANGSYSNMLITNYGDVTLGRRISTPDDKYTFGAVIGGNYKTETTTGEIGIHTVIVEAGRYNNIVVGSTLTAGGQTTKSKYVSHQVMIGNMKDSAISRNDNLTITGSLLMGELEDRCYPYNASGSQDSASAYTRTYAITKIYSGTFTGHNKFAKASEDASIFLRSVNGFTDGATKFEMYGGDINGNVYAGSRLATTGADQDENILDFYGGTITGNVFGHGSNDSSVGNSNIELGGRFAITGNVFGASNATTIGQGKVTGNSTIKMNTASVTVDGNIYGGSNGRIDGTSINLNNGLITGDTNIVLNAGTVTGDIFGGGYNCGNTGSANITINNGVVTGSIYGGAYQNQVRTETNISITGGTVNAIYGGNVLTSSTQQNSDNTKQNANIIIDGADAIVNGPIYGNGKYDKVGTATINLISCATTPTVFGGSEGPGITDVANINLEGMTVSEIYGGTDGVGTVTTANINLKSGTVTDVYGGGYGGTTTTSNVNLGSSDGGNATVTSIYGGANTAGTVGTSNVILKSGTVTNVFGGGNSATVGTANVTLDGITIDTIHGGSKDAKVTTNTNVVLKSGTVTNVFGGGLGTSTTNAKVTQQGATVENIYGGGHGGTGDGGTTTNATVNIDSSRAVNIYGGSMTKGITKNATINIRGNSLITGKLYGGGYKTETGKSNDTGITTINISGGTINKDIYGGAESSAVYGTTNINIGVDAVTDNSPVAGSINIKGNIYGGGTVVSTDYSYTGVYGNTHVTLDNSTQSPITFNKNIFGSGKGSIYSTSGTDSDESTVRIKDFGTASNSYRMISVQRTGKVYIGNSHLELTGAKDSYNYYKDTLYTLNRVTKGLALHDNSTLYTRRGFNMVGGFESFLTNSNGTTTKETVSISGNSVTRNVDNRLYTFEGINLIFAKQEGELSDKASQDIWGDVNGMAFFGMYRISRTNFQKEYDIYDPNYKGGAKENFFANGTYIEGRHKANHDTSVDGFYTNVADYSDTSNITVMPKVIEVTDYGTYYDWIIGEDIVNYDVGPLIASTYSTWSQVELKLDYKYRQGAMYTLNRVSSNALDENINLVNKSDIQTIASGDTANNTFALTVEGEKTGWLKNGVTNMYTDGNGSFDGNKVFKSDNSSDPGTLIFKIFNSINVTETKDLGNINVVLIGKTRTGDDASQGNVFRVIISVSLQSLYEEPKDQYTPRFTDSTETNLNYTTDSSIDISYILYKTGLTDTIYTSGDYRTLSSTVQLPAGTRITMRDYGQGDNVNKVYYYQIGSNTAYDSTENVDGKTRYVYKLSHFRDIGTNTTDFTGTGDYANNNSSYYHSGTEGSGYALEKYDISINLVDSNINANQLEQETYLQLRSADGRIKYDNGEKDIIYNLYNNNATMEESISNEGRSYSVFENLSIPFTFDGTVLEKVVGAGGTVAEANGENATESTRIHDTKYYEQKVGLAIEIVDEVGERVKAPELQNFRLTNNNDSTLSYEAGEDGVIRVPLSEGLAKIQNNYNLSLSQYNVPAGIYKARIYFFTSDDGLHYNEEKTLVKEINITFINRLLGLAGVESTNDSRIINKTTGLNLEGNEGLDLTVKVGAPTDDTNIRVELYKRNPTYTVTEDESGTGSTTETYTGTQYTQVDISQYLEGNWEKPEDQGLVTAEGCIEYMVMPKETYGSVVDLKTVDFKKAIKQGISTGEYKLVFKAYYDNTVIQTVTKTFVVTP